MLERIPVRIEATSTTVMMPTTMPSTVNALRNLFERSESRAMPTVSVGKIFESTCLIESVLRHRHDGIETRCLPCRINAGNHSDSSGNDQRERDIAHGDRHWNRSRRADDP